MNFRKETKAQKATKSTANEDHRQSMSLLISSIKSLFPAQPLSVLTNLAYVAAGLLAHSVALSLAFYILAAGSTWYHWQEGKNGEYADQFGMFLILLLLVQHSLIFAVIAAALLSVYFIWNPFSGIDQNTSMNSYSLLAAFYIAGFGIHLSVMAFISLILIILALIIREKSIDKKGVSTDKLHSLWHVLSAAALLILSFA